MTKSELIMTLLKGIDLMRDTHAVIGDVWKLPTPYHCLLFASSEMGEFSDDLIKNDQLGQSYARNNVVDVVDPTIELTDAGMMLLSYIISCHKPTLYPEGSLDHIFSIVKSIADNMVAQDDDILVFSLPPWFGYLGRVIVYNTDDNTARIRMLIDAEIMRLEKSLALNLPYPKENAVLALLMLISDNRYTKSSFLSYLDKKLQKTITKVSNREMNFAVRENE